MIIYSKQILPETNMKLSVPNLMIYLRRHKAKLETDASFRNLNKLLTQVLTKMPVQINFVISVPDYIYIIGGKET